MNFPPFGTHVDECSSCVCSTASARLRCRARVRRSGCGCSPQGKSTDRGTASLIWELSIPSSPAVFSFPRSLRSTTSVLQQPQDLTPRHKGQLAPGTASAGAPGHSSAATRVPAAAWQHSTATANLPAGGLSCYRRAQELRGGGQFIRRMG